MPPRLPRSSLQQLFAPVTASRLCNASRITVTTAIRSFGIKPMYPPKVSHKHLDADVPILASHPIAAHLRKAATLPLRTGALAIKKGMTAIYDPETGVRTPCTVLQLDGAQVISHKTLEKNGYCAVQVGSGFKSEKNVTRPMLGHFSTNGVSPKLYIHEFRVKDETGLLPVGEVINADWFQEGQYVDVRSNSRGMGFAGAMKKWGFHGQDRSHGVSLTHRSLGSTAPSQGGGSRVYPGKKMPGRMGNHQVTLQSLKVLKVDAEKGIVVVKGSVAGPRGRCVKIQDAIKKPWPKIEATKPAPVEE
ncbi:hypothetical protein MauCBS54593_004361 [Microsporum audouinii]